MTNLEKIVQEIAQGGAEAMMELIFLKCRDCPIGLERNYGHEIIDWLNSLALTDDEIRLKRQEFDEENSRRLAHSLAYRGGDIEPLGNHGSYDAIVNHLVERLDSKQCGRLQCLFLT